MDESLLVVKRRPDFIVFPEYYNVNPALRDTLRNSGMAYRHLNYCKTLSDRFDAVVIAGSAIEVDRNQVTILAETAELLKRSIRQDVDSAYRYGGDEFVVLLPGLDRPTAKKVARRIREAVCRRKKRNHVSLSVGAAGLRTGEELEDLVRRADERMYRVKRRRKSLRRRSSQA